MKTKLRNGNQIINDLLREEEKRLIVPASLHTRLIKIKNTARVDLQRLTAEALLVGIKRIEKKYISNINS